MFLYLLDVSDYEKIDGLVEKVDAIVGADGLNILLNNAGIYYGPDGLADLEADKFTRTLAVMVIGRAMLTKVSLRAQGEIDRLETINHFKLTSCVMCRNSGRCCVVQPH